MKLIPVIDLMAGLVVHARRGERENYRPISSTLCPSAAPEAILQALIECYACDTVYIADLDAIRFRRPQLALIEQLRTRFPQIDIWLDIGIAELENFLSASRLELGTLVIGSESVLDSAWLNDLDETDVGDESCSCWKRARPGLYTTRKSKISKARLRTLCRGRCSKQR
jgi:uncharacterized protein related to proFAR isomerase